MHTGDDGCHYQVRIRIGTGRSVLEPQVLFVRLGNTDGYEPVVHAPVRLNRRKHVRPQATE